MIHINQLGSTTAVDPTKLRDVELWQLLETLTIETKTRSPKKCKELDDNEKEQVKFLNKCRNLVQFVLPRPTKADTKKPLENSYQLFESMVSMLHAHM